MFAWDLFRAYALCVLAAVLAVSVCSKLSAALLFMALLVLHGYVLVEHHFFSPVQATVNYARPIAACTCFPSPCCYSATFWSWAWPPGR